MSARVDVVIPAYNGARTIESAIASIQAQTVRDIRIIVVNDGSTDRTGAIVAELARNDDRIVQIDQANGGIVDALNAGLAACDAEFIARHDADDLAAPDRFERQLDYLDRHPDCVAVSGAVRHIDTDGRVIAAYKLSRPAELADATRYPQREPYLPHPFLMARRAAIEDVGGYRYVFHAEDVDLYWRLRDRGRLHNMTDVLGDYRIHAESVTSASVLNGRISAVSSQRSGIASMRRRAGRPDLLFPKSFLAECQAARSLEAIVHAGARDLDEEEAERLAASTCAKLIEFVNYRPYKLEMEDCRFIRRTLTRVMPHMEQDSRQWCRVMLSKTATSLVISGDLSLAARLSTLRLVPVVFARLCQRSLRSVKGRRR